MESTVTASATGQRWPDRNYARELLRPWKLATFAAGMGWLIYGALNYGIGDWDVGDSLLMGGLTYISAPWCVGTLWTCVARRPRGWPLWMMLALFVAWSVVDGSYVLYNSLARHPMDRAANFPASAALYLLAGCIWCYRGSLRELWRDLRKARAHRQRPS